jgi:NADH-quinone oxidoreductase subunit C
MTNRVEELVARLKERFNDQLSGCQQSCGEITVEVPAMHLRAVCMALRDEPEFGFEQLMDLCGVDYSTYGQADWQTEAASNQGFSRGVAQAIRPAEGGDRPRFAVVYHLLSLKHNQRLRIKVFAPDDPPRVDSVVDIWASADWYEREAFDLFGILFDGHPDLRRILTDYGFIGHPFRKDFPLEGNVEVRYDPEKGRVVYQPVSIENRVLVPRVIRRKEGGHA